MSIMHRSEVCAGQTIDIGLIANNLVRRNGRLRQCGGESGIRTHGTVSRTHAFQACALSHSAISPVSSLETAWGLLQETVAVMTAILVTD